MRIDRDECLQTIEHVGALDTSVALIALCRNHDQLREYKDVIHHIDDYILAENLIGEELHTRITHAIRRRLKEQELLHEQTLLRTLLDNMPDAIFFKDLKSRFTKINRTMERTYRNVHKSIIGKTDFDLFAREHAQRAFDDEKHIIKTGEPMIAKLEKETFEDGRVNWVSTTKLPLKDDGGRIIGTMGISRNITDLKHFQDKLDEERTLLKTIIDHALAGIFVKDVDGRYVVVNKRHLQYLGATNERQVIGKTIEDFLDKEHAQRVTSEDRRIMQSVDGVENIIDHRRKKDGREIWLMTSKVPLRNSDGSCNGLVGITLDVTEQKLNERTLKHTIQTLEETKLQLIEAEKLKTVGRLAAGVAHEVKNPLNVVSLGAEYLEKQIDGPEEILQIVRDMRVAVSKANSVIFDLLDYSSPHEVRMEPSNINELLSRVIGLMRHNFNKAGISVTENLGDNIDPVYIDESKMEQVFINLFLNAISVTDKGGNVEVRTFMEHMTQTGDNVSGPLTELFRIGDKMLVIEILDTGSGLSPDAAKKAFDPFYSTKSTGEGTGLGLSVTRSIVDMHQGMITLENRNDRPGACARIRLPKATTKAYD